MPWKTMTLTNPFDRAPEHVWNQVAALDAEHEARLAEQENQPEPVPELPPESSHPNIVKRELAELDRQIRGAWGRRNPVSLGGREGMVDRLGRVVSRRMGFAEGREGRAEAGRETGGSGARTMGRPALAGAR
jgi:hypothetical protein